MEKEQKKIQLLLAGDISQEMEEIKKAQSTMPYFLTLLSNTCADFLTIMCC